LIQRKTPTAMAGSFTSQVAEDKRTLQATVYSLQLSALNLGANTKFKELASLIDKAIIKAQAEIIAADDIIQSNN
jgi:hypothetical protein